jgi:hypothetical protein
VAAGAGAKKPNKKRNEERTPRWWIMKGRRFPIELRQSSRFDFLKAIIALPHYYRCDDYYTLFLAVARCDFSRAVTFGNGSVALGITWGCDLTAIWARESDYNS